MKKNNLWITFLLVIMSLCFTLALTACNGNTDSGESGQSSVYTAADIRYVSDKDAEVAVVAGRTYTKTNGGTAAVALAYINGYTGPVLVGTSSNAVSYIFNYGGTNVVDDYGTVEVDGRDWYYSKNIGFMGGNYLDFDRKGEIYCSKQTSAEEVAKELIGILDKSKFAETQILTAEDLTSIANSGDDYVLGADIDLSSVTEWTPIEGFKGTLSGGGYKITNLTINGVNEDNIGLFGTLQGSVKDLVIENAQISYRGNKGNVGIVAGTCTGTVKNVQVSGTVQAKNAGTVGETGVGGVVGYLGAGGRLCKNMNFATVSGMNDVGGIAGLVCLNGDSLIDDNLNQGEVDGTGSIGGVVGYVTCNSYKSTNKYTYEISNNSNEGPVSGKTDVGGVFGYVYARPNNYYGSSYVNYINISLLKNSAVVVGSGDNVGGLIGGAENVSSLTLCENTGDVTGANYVGGFAGKASGANIDAGHFKNTSTITGKAAVGAFGGYVGTVSYAENEGSVVSLAPYVDENGTSYANVGGIAGIASGIIECINRIDITVTHSGQNVGGIVGQCVVYKDGTYTGNVNYGSITGKENVGGISGFLTCKNKGTTETDTYEISDNSNKGNITGGDRTGGISGYTYAVKNNYYGSTYKNYFVFTLCENVGEISADGNCAGGISGEAINLSRASLCENTGSITGKNYVGGLFGSANGTRIQASGFENSATVKGNAYVGGIAGYAGIVENATTSAYGQIISVEPAVENGVSVAYVGGIVGYCRGIISCENYAEINVSHSGIYVAGVAGYIDMGGVDQVKDNSNYGDVTGTGYTGGIAAYVAGGNLGDTKSRTYLLINNDNYGKIVGTDYAGGIVGYINAMADTYYGSTYKHYVQMTNCDNHGEVCANVAGGLVGGYVRLKTDANIMDTNTTDYGEKLGQYL